MSKPEGLEKAIRDMEGVPSQLRATLLSVIRARATSEKLHQAALDSSNATKKANGPLRLELENVVVELDSFSYEFPPARAILSLVIGNTAGHGVHLSGVENITKLRDFLNAWFPPG